MVIFLHLKAYSRVGKMAFGKKKNERGFRYYT